MQSNELPGWISTSWILAQKLLSIVFMLQMLRGQIPVHPHGGSAVRVCCWSTMVALCVAADADLCAAMKKLSDRRAEPRAQPKPAWLLCFRSEMILEEQNLYLSQLRSCLKQRAVLSTLSRTSGLQCWCLVFRRNMISCSIINKDGLHCGCDMHIFGC